MSDSHKQGPLLCGTSSSFPLDSCWSLIQFSRKALTTKQTWDRYAVHLLGLGDDPAHSWRGRRGYAGLPLLGQLRDLGAPHQELIQETLGVRNGLSYISFMWVPYISTPTTVSTNHGCGNF